MVGARKTQLFSRWLDSLDDLRARARVLVRIERLLVGNAGDTRNVGEGVCELRVDFGPDYRVCHTRQG